MFARGYIEVLFKTSDTPLAREFDAGLARHPGVHIVAFGVADAAAAHGRLARAGFGCGRWSRCSERSTPAGSP